jgi:serine/threonine-protein kinase RsbW
VKAGAEVTDHVELRVPSRAEHLALVRVVVTTVAETIAGLDGVRLEDLRLAVSEACANAVEAYTRQGRAGTPIVLRLRAERGRIEVEIHDDAGGFDPDELVPHPPVDTPERLHHERGLGVPLMRALADVAEFVPEGDGTTVRLVLQEAGAR